MTPNLELLRNTAKIWQRDSSEVAEMGKHARLKYQPPCPPSPCQNGNGWVRAPAKEMGTFSSKFGSRARAACLGADFVAMPTPSAKPSARFMPPGKMTARAGKSAARAASLPGSSTHKDTKRW